MDQALIILAASSIATLLGLALLAAARWQSQVTGAGLAKSNSALLLIPGWKLTLLGFLVLFFSLASYLGVALWLALVGILLMALTQRRVGQRRALLRLLAATTRGGQPLPPAVAAFAQDVRGPLGQQALKLNLALELGTPLASALPVVTPLASKRARALLYLGQQTGTLTEALELAAEEQEPDGMAGEMMAHVMYLFWIFVVAAGVLGFVMLKIIPAFKQIFEDFGTVLPAMTQVVISASTLAGHFWPLVVGIQLGLCATMLLATLIYIGWIDWRMPLPLPWLRGMETSAVLRGLAMTAEARRPIDQGLEALATIYPDAWVRGGLEQATREVSSGMPWWQSLHRQRLIGSADRALLQAAERVGNVPWALRSIAQRHRWQLTYRLRWWLHLLTPPLLVLLGAIVGFIVIGLFMPLIKIIEVLT